MTKKAILYGDFCFQIPNLPTPTDRIPLKNPNASTTSTTTATPNYSDYDVDESLAGR